MEDKTTPGNRALMVARRQRRDQTAVQQRRDRDARERERLVAAHPLTVALKQRRKRAEERRQRILRREADVQNQRRRLVIEEMKDKRRKYDAKKTIRRTVELFNKDVNNMVQRILNEDGARFEIRSNEFGSIVFQRLRKVIGDRQITMGTSNGTYRTLNMKNLDSIIMKLKNKSFAVEQPSYDDENYLRIEDIVNSGTLTTEFVGRDEFVRVPWQGGSDDINGSFFKWFNKTDLDLTDLQIYNDGDEIKAESDSCFVWALKMSGRLDKTQLQSLRNKHATRMLSQKNIKKIADDMGLYITVDRPESNNHKRHYGKKTHNPIKLGLVDNHYFLIKTIDVTSYALKNYEEIKHLPRWNKINKKRDGGYRRAGDRQINSYDVVKLLLENKETLLREIPMEDLQNTLYHKINPKIESLDYNEELTSKWELGGKCSGWNEEDTVLVFFDFETVTNGKIHVPYMVRMSGFNSAFVGKECGLDMLKTLSKKYPDKNFMLIAHNLGYDFRFIEKYLRNISLLERGTSIMRGQGEFVHPNTGKRHDICVQDSYAFLSCKLADFGSYFKFEIEKELLSYEIYTQENVERRFIPLEEVLDCKDIADKKEEYEIKLRKQKCIDKNNMVDIIKYSSYYCKRDVDILEKGWNIFKGWIQEEYDCNVNNFCSAAQFGNYVMSKGGVYGDVIAERDVSGKVIGDEDYERHSNVIEQEVGLGHMEIIKDPVMKLSLHPREFIQRAMVGGRTMTRCNKKWWVKKRLADFDAVSLYPSAQMRLGGYLIGLPKVITNLDYDDLKTKDGYFVEIRIISVGIKRDFPIMCKTRKDGVKEWTNDMEGEIITVDKTSLEDLIEFQNVKFEILRGYYFNEGRNNNLTEVVERVFQQRKKYKKDKNPIEKVFKLILNSSYGKTLLKAIMCEAKIQDFYGETDETIEKNLNKYIAKNYNKINEYNKMLKDGRYRFKLERQINDHFNHAQCGVEVLSMSKRIMNEVMCLAEDLGLNIYYQDTDSIHIPVDEIPILSAAYDKKYGRTLIGKDMGQFHEDFDSKILKGNQYSIESIFLAKKVYIDILNSDESPGVEDIHQRMKSIPQPSFYHYCEKYNLSPLEVYIKHFEDEEAIYDLTCDGKSMKLQHNKDGSISSKRLFMRSVKFTGVEAIKVF